jgi:hypothetical protein
MGLQRLEMHNETDQWGDPSQKIIFSPEKYGGRASGDFAKEKLVMKCIDFFGVTITLIALALTTTTGCKKENPLPGSLQEIEYTCPEGEAVSYFEGIIDEQLACFKAGINSYQLRTGLQSSFTTFGPTLELGGSDDSLDNFRIRAYIGLLPRDTIGVKKFIPTHTPYIDILSPAEEQSDSELYFFEEYFGEEGELPLNDSAYIIQLKYNQGYPDGGITFSTDGANQEGSYLLLNKVEKTPVGDGLQYDLEFEFSCKLYYTRTGSHYPEKVYYTTIEDGRMSVSFVL